MTLDEVRQYVRTQIAREEEHISDPDSAPTDMRFCIGRLQSMEDVLRVLDRAADVGAK